MEGVHVSRKKPCFIFSILTGLFIVIGLWIYFCSPSHSQSIDLFSNSTSIKPELEEKQQESAKNLSNQVNTNTVLLAILHGEKGSQSTNEVGAKKSDVSLNKTKVPSLLERERSLDVKVKFNTTKESSRFMNNGTLRSLQDQANGLNTKDNPTMPDSSNLKKGIPKLDQDLGNVMSTEKAIERKAGIVWWIKSKAYNGDPANIDELKMKRQEMESNLANEIMSDLNNAQEEDVENKRNNLPKFEVNSDLGTEDEEAGNFDEDNR